MNDKIALFFDCENISAKYVDEIVKELSSHGEVVIKKAFRDWSKDSKWNKDLIEKYGIEPIQIFTQAGKNSTDLRIQRDVLEIKNKAHINTICLVTSDSDFRDLVMNVRGDGLDVIGFGEEKTSQALRNVYTTFIELPINKNIQDKKQSELIKVLKRAIEDIKDDNGYCSIARLGQYLKNQNSSFIPKNYGGKTWSQVLKNLDEFKLSYLNNGKNDTLIVSVK